MQIVVLGPVGIERGGETADVGPRLRRLLAALTVRHGSVVSSDRLIDIVWEGDPPPSADRTLKSYVARLRQALGESGDALTFRQPGYVLHLDRGSIDADVFESECDDVSRLVRMGELHDAGELLERALGRWTGRAYAGYAHEEWARPEAVRLEERLHEARETQIDMLLADDQHDRAVGLAKSLIEAEPLRERPRELLMKALYRSGRQAEALREFQSFSSMLGEETGLQPSPELTELEGQIVTGELARSAPLVVIRGYELGERVGQGAFSVVHRAIQPEIQREVAIKIIRAELANRPEFVRRFEVEATTIARVEHPNVVPLYDFWREPGAGYLVMRLLRGGSVAEAIARNGAYSARQVVALLADVAGALTEAHRVGVIHRDVRPKNLLLDEGGNTYVADFGIAGMAAAGNGETLSDVSLAYASPEVLRGELAGVSADVLSLGVTVFELLTARLPFADSTDRAHLVQRQMHEPLPPVRSTRPEISPVVDEILARATAKAPADRHPSVRELADELSGALGERRDADHRRPPTTQTATNPYVGLHAFTEQDAERFFGRDTLVAELVDAIGARPFVLLAGASGSGKSSVVRAGVVPALRRGALPGSDQWFVTTMVPGDSPIDAFETALLRVAVNPPNSLRAQLQEDGGLLRAVRRVLPDDRSTVFILIDQFEELFTQTDDAQRARFLDELAAAIAADGSPLKVVATIRADHYDAPLGHPGMAALVAAGTVSLQPLTPAELEQVIVSPAGRVGVEVEPALVAELAAAVANEPAALPLLQYSLTELFDRRVSGVMLHSTHRELGGLSGALAARADGILDHGEAIDPAVAREIFGRLVNVTDASSDTRRRALRSELGDDPAVDRLVAAFVDARLLATDRDPATREPIVEVAHEALLRDWPRLSEWLRDDRADLIVLHSISSATAGWIRNERDTGELARGVRLENATALMRRHPDRFTDLEQEWVQASQLAADEQEAQRRAAADRDRRQNRRLRRLLAVAAGLLIVAAGSVVVALVLRDRAVASERDAEIERLIAVSGVESADEKDRGILLALEAYRQRPDQSTLTAVHRAMITNPGIVGVFTGPIPDPTQSILDGDGSHGMSRTDPDDVTSLVAFEVGARNASASPVEIPVGIHDAELSESGEFVSLIREDAVVTVLDLRSGATIGELEFEEPPWQVHFSGDDRRIAITTDVATVVELADMSTTLMYEAPDDMLLVDAMLSPDGSLLAVVATSEFAAAPETVFVDLLDVDSGEPVRRIDGMSSFPWTALLTHDRRLVVGHEDGTLGIHEVDTDDEPRIVEAHDQSILEIAVNPAGDVASASETGSVKLWTADGDPIGAPFEFAGLFGDIAIADDRTVTVAGDDRPLVRFGPGVPGVTLDGTDATGQTTAGSNRPHFDELLPDAGGVRIRDFETGETLAELDMSDRWPSGVLERSFYSPSGTFVATYAADFSEAAIWSIEGTERHVLEVPRLYEAMGLPPQDQGGIAIRPSNDGARLFVSVAGPEDGGLAAAWLSIPDLEVLAGPLEVPDFGAVLALDDGRVLLGGGQLTLLDAALTEEPTPIPSGDSFWPMDQDERTGLVALGGENGDIGLFDPSTATIRRLDDVPGWVTDVAISPDGSKLAAVTFDGLVQVIDVGSGAAVGAPVPLGSPSDVYPGVRWADDGRGAWVSGGGDPVLLMTDPSTWIAKACAMVDRDLTAEEWSTFVSDTTDPVPAPCPART